MMSTRPEAPTRLLCARTRHLSQAAHAIRCGGCASHARWAQAYLPAGLERAARLASLLRGRASRLEEARRSRRVVYRQEEEG